MLDGRVLGASQVEYKPFRKPPLQREPHRRRGRETRNRAGLPLSAAPGRGGVRAPERAAPPGPGAAASADHRPAQ